MVMYFIIIAYKQNILAEAVIVSFTLNYHVHVIVGAPGFPGRPGSTGMPGATGLVRDGWSVLNDVIHDCCL